MFCYDFCASETGGERGVEWGGMIGIFITVTATVTVRYEAIRTFYGADDIPPPQPSHMLIQSRTLLEFLSRRHEMAGSENVTSIEASKHQWHAHCKLSFEEGFAIVFCWPWH